MPRGLIGKGDKFTPYNPNLKMRSRNMRHGMTPAEKRLWYEYLQGHRLNFTRQKPIDHFIADFYCPKAKLIIEVDGDSHFSDQGRIYDDERTNILNSYGLQVIRFTNQEIVHDLANVMRRIEEAIRTRMDNKPPSSPFDKGVS